MKGAPAWREAAIRKDHAREAFDCGAPALNEFVRRYARQSHELGGAKTFVAEDEGDGRTIHGFYSLSPASMKYELTPEVVRRGLARHEVPCFRLARLAVDRRQQGKGLGGELLMAAGRRCWRASQEVGGVALLIDAKDEKAAAWYEGYGALRLKDTRLTLMLPLATIAAALERAGRAT